MQDLRLAFRALRGTPIVSTVAVLSLALGIGANTAIFSLVDSLLLRTLPIPEPQRLVLVSARQGLARPFSYAIFDQIRQHSQSFDGTLAYNCCGKGPVTIGGDTEMVTTQWVSGDFFTTLGVPALLGRTFTPADDVPGGGPSGPVVVISYRLWQRRFGGAASVIGTSITIDRVPVTIVGVTPPDFFGVEVGRAVDLSLPIQTQPVIAPSIAFNVDITWLGIMLRLKPDQSLAAATAALRAFQPQIRAAAMPQAFTAPDSFLREPLTLESVGSGLSDLRPQYERPLVAILLIVALVLLIACANIANLQLARGAARRHELSVRLALGASRWRLGRQLLIESVVLAMIGGTLGLVFSNWASRAIVAQLSTSRTPIVLDLSPHWQVLAFTAATMVATVVLFGVAPALRASRVAPMEALKDSGRTAPGARFALSSGLIVVQVALSLMLVVAAGLFVRTFERLARVSLGFDRDRALVVTVTAPTVSAIDRNAFYHRLVSTAATVPGVAYAGGSLNPPLIGTMTGEILVTVPGAEIRSDAETISQFNDITPGWLAAYGTGIRAGRDFNDRDTTRTPPVMLVNEALVRRFFPGQNVVGSTFALTARQAPFGDVALGSRTVVGVVNDAVYRSIRAPLKPTVYVPLAQREGPLLYTNFYLTVRSLTGPPALLTRNVTDALTAVNRDLRLVVQPLADEVTESLARDRLVGTLSGFFGALALLLAGLGLYGVTAYAVARRRTEIGIRMALGAAPAGIVRLVLSRVSLMVGLGVLIGTGVSLWATTFVASLLYGLKPRDPVTLIGAAAALTGVGGLAGWLPAWRASRIDPAVVLRES